MDQLIGGGGDGPMIVDEYSSRPNVPNDHFGSNARHNFPSGFSENPRNNPIAAAAGFNRPEVDFGASMGSQDLARAIAASMDDY